MMEHLYCLATRSSRRVAESRRRESPQIALRRLVELNPTKPFATRQVSITSGSSSWLEAGSFSTLDGDPRVASE
jgi:hypothetical protein